MIHTHHFRLMVALMIMELPMMAMSMSKKDINHMRDEIYVVLIGLNDNTEKWTQHGMRYLRNHANELPRLSFGQLRCSSEIQKQLLKYLVIKKEKALLSTFIDMYQRTHHHNREGINFIYKLESKDGRRKQIIEYTLLDVALTAYCQALEKKEAGQAESNILTLLVDQGAEFKLYRDCDHNDETEQICDPIFMPFISSDVDPLFDIQAENNEIIMLESGALIRFDLGDSKE